MLRRLRRPAVATLSIATLLPIVTACSSDEPEASAAAPARIDAVSFTGKVGQGVKATWHSTIARPKSTTVSTLVRGEGAEIESGDSVSTYLWIGNGSTKKMAYSDYSNGTPESIPNDSQLSKLFKKVFKDATYGSRVAAVTTVSDLFGSSGANSQLGINADDSVVVVADLVNKAATSPKPSDGKAHDVPASALPRVVLKNGKPTGLDWKRLAKPALTTPVKRLVIKQGDGARVSASDTVTVRYLGATYRAKKPFDQNYTSTTFTQSLNSLIPGWKIGLQGVRLGSRVLLQIPPAYGYGAEGSGTTIPGNATLWFVIDVLKAK